MSPRLMLAAGGAAILGALGWGAITYFTGYEVGYVAWGIGALVGGAAVAVGGRGSVCGISCGLMALAAIFLGKVLAVQFTISGELEKLVEEGLTRAQYNESVKDASDFAALASPDDHPRFMVDHDFTEAKEAKKVTPAELADFEGQTVPTLLWIHVEKPSYEDWRARQAAEFKDIFASKVSIASLVIQDLGAIDLIFALLGISTAYRLPARREDT